jgi:hypothetical protein
VVVNKVVRVDLASVADLPADVAASVAEFHSRISQ